MGSVKGRGGPRKPGKGKRELDKLRAMYERNPSEHNKRIYFGALAAYGRSRRS